eukprot:CAMPEP_0195508638 /NCGR_PEP_ID=MMETSP0794_2-20130614/1794_1 /TAXON_ID=515487 /ORGANISM="Stephanopyxis turris, Strain CCMP 815" /LENGTH=514 /DNA_ID=CAMNT_0040635647 /DNA_START=51 /DNA_END=1595 /DNA_ORIENTATION=+
MTLHYSLFLVAALLSSSTNRLNSNGVAAFIVNSPLSRKTTISAFVKSTLSLPFIQKKRSFSCLPLSPNSELNESYDDDDDDDDEEIDTSSLGDWRKFRMNLAETGLNTNDDDNDDEDSSSSPSSTSGESSKKQPKRKSVSKLNEQLLESQNEKLAKEYKSEVWAHETAKAEVGGLVCRLPLEAEIYRNKPTDLGRKLHKRLSLSTKDDYDEDSAITSDSLTTDMEDAGYSGGGVSFSPGAAKTVFWYRAAQTLISNELKKVTSKASPTSEEDERVIDASNLDPASLELLNIYMDNQASWQEVCLVVDDATTLVINRPLSTTVNKDLAQLVLFGQYSRLNSREGGVSPSKTSRFVRFLTAFEHSCALYVGGPDKQTEPAIMIHGIAELDGAVEISPGCGIYKNGLEAAIDGVINGVYDPLEFRFFVGRHEYGSKNKEEESSSFTPSSSSSLDLAVLEGKYQPVACARSLALKQCIGLPKPLWHEVMELCGGELKEISSLELMKRDDIQIEEEFED